MVILTDGLLINSEVYFFLYTCQILHLSEKRLVLDACVDNPDLWFLSSDFFKIGTFVIFSVESFIVSCDNLLYVIYSTERFTGSTCFNSFLF